MKTALVITGVLIGAAVFFQKVIRWRWFRDPVEDRWLAARAIEELLHPDDYFGDVGEFTSISIRNDATLRQIQESVIRLFEDDGNFTQPPRIGNEYPALSASGRSRVIELGQMLERELAGYRCNPEAREPGAG